MQVRTLRRGGSEEPFTALLYGVSGAGKTVTAATAPGPILFLDCDGGLSVIESNPQLMAKLDIVEADISAVRIGGYQDTLGILEQIPGDRWATIVLDNLTALQERLMTDLLIRRNQMAMEQRDWGTLLLEMRAILNRLQEKRTNMILLAQERNDEMGGAGIDLSGALLRSIPRYVSLQARCCMLAPEEEGAKKQNPVRRLLRCQPMAVPMIRAKCRYEKIGEWEDPHIRKMIEKIRGE